MLEPLLAHDASVLDTASLRRIRQGGREKVALAMCRPDLSPAQRAVLPPCRVHRTAGEHIADTLEVHKPQC